MSAQSQVLRSLQDLIVSGNVLSVLAFGARPRGNLRFYLSILAYERFFSSNHPG